MREHLDTDDLSDLEGESAEKTRISTLFHRDYLRRTIFACTFWSAIVLPYLALTFFQSLLGGLTSYWLAPETKGRSLSGTSHRSDPHHYGRKKQSVTVG